MLPPMNDGAASRPSVTAVLGPTNTGKTYLAIERMLGHRTGMMGFPLRLLARENYDRVCRQVGERYTALVTGEEKIIPPEARYFLCTVESMPLDRRVDFLAIDEIQMCADAERGHIFTDRLLHARGDVETMFLGADTMRPVIKGLTPEAAYLSRPRFSKLSFAGQRRLARVPPRSAIVAFTANDVYALAEQVRRGRGGAAVVLGALSPRTRNAQVAMYQAGEVDYLVATDAIGMGLNMDVDHVAFASLRKFDGRRYRQLLASEIAQIAGRAGRHMADGTFGTLDNVAPPDADVIDRIENHRFQELEAVWWRNDGLDFSSVQALLGSLDAPPPSPRLMKAFTAEDQRALIALSHDHDVMALANGADAVALLWDVCQIPDFRQTLTEAHTRFVARIFGFLRGAEGKLPTDWVANQIAQLDRVDGDIDTLMNRISHVRTWTYVTHRPHWIEDAIGWQERARALEDRLSDALHEALTQRFVDRRAAALSRMRGKENLSAAVEGDGGVSVEGQYVGKLDGFRFQADDAAGAVDRPALTSAARRALGDEIARRVRALEAAPEFALALDPASGSITWLGAPVAKLAAGADALSPRAELAQSEFLEPALAERARTRLQNWLDAHVRDVLGPLKALETAPLDGAARGIAFQLREALGSMPRRACAAQIAALTQEDRAKLRALRIRLGMESVFLPELLKPKAVALRAALWALADGGERRPAPPAPGLVTTPTEPGVPNAFYEAVGFRVLAGRAVRIDMLDRVAILMMTRMKKGPFQLDAELLTPLGLGVEQMVPMVGALGYQVTVAEEGAATVEGRIRRPRREDRPRRRPRKAAPAAGGNEGEAKAEGAAAEGERKPRRRRGKRPGGKPDGKPGGKPGGQRPPRREKPIDPDSPFAKLAELLQK
jgi:ATP-dependent RNA helicase SUPV3L1/SUV3